MSHMGIVDYLCLYAGVASFEASTHRTLELWQDLNGRNPGLQAQDNVSSVPFAWYGNDPDAIAATSSYRPHAWLGIVPSGMQHPYSQSTAQVFPAS